VRCRRVSLSAMTSAEVRSAGLHAVAAAAYLPESMTGIWDREPHGPSFDVIDAAAGLTDRRWRSRGDAPDGHRYRVRSAETCPGPTHPRRRYSLDAISAAALLRGPSPSGSHGMTITMRLPNTCEPPVVYPERSATRFRVDVRLTSPGARGERRGPPS